MALEKLIEVIHSGSKLITGDTDVSWKSANGEAHKSLFGSEGGRYELKAKSAFVIRAPGMKDNDSGIPFAAYINQDKPLTGAYGGDSFVLFPSAGDDAPCLVGLGVGTNGLAPDEGILGRPGHARKARAIADWLNAELGGGKLVAWAKQDPTRIDLQVPDEIKAEFPGHEAALRKYGHVMYLLFHPTSDLAQTSKVVRAILDIMFEERGFAPLAAHREDASALQSSWLAHLMPQLELSRVKELLRERRYVIVQGPPGTGKTRMARQLLRDDYKKNGRTVQFHPNTSYEAFVGGLAPLSADESVGLRFNPQPGFLMEAAAAARQNREPYLLHIDEINRADLSKILGEAIYLFETDPEEKRTLTLQYDFGPPFHRELELPDNLHVLGTMNSADRSIAIVDIAVRRRFAFLSLWPQMSTVADKSGHIMCQAFQRLVSIFLEYASDDAFNLMPGHSYFLQKDDIKAREQLKTTLAPLLEEYLAQGYVSGFAEPIRGYLQYLRSL